MVGRVELFEAIRRGHRREGLSVRALAARHRSHPRPAPAIGPWVSVIDEWLIGDRDVPRKQRHTARRIWQRLGS